MGIACDFCGAAPVTEHYTRSERVQCPLMGYTSRSATRGARIRVRGGSVPANRYDAARHATGQMPVTALLTETR